MTEKKTEVLTIRLTLSTKKALESEAAKREWSISKIAEKILASWAEEKDNPNNLKKVNFMQNEIHNIQIL